MTLEPYNDAVRRRFADPLHAGTVSDGVAVVEAAQGVRLELSARLEQGRIVALRFRAWACPHLIAAAEVFCENFEGADVGQLDEFTGGPITKELDVPVEKAGRILVLEDAVRSLVGALGARHAART